MNYLQIIIIIIIVGLTIIGYLKGLIKTLINIASLILSIFGAYIISPFLSKFIKSLPVYQDIIIKINDKINLQNADSYQSVTDQTQLIESLGLSEKLTNYILANNNTDFYELLHISTIEQYISTIIASLVVSVMCFIVVLIFIRIFISLLKSITEIAANLPGLKSIDKLLGGIFGLFEGLIISWIILLVLPLFMKDLYTMIESSKLLTFLYDKNIFINMFLNQITFI